MSRETPVPVCSEQGQSFVVGRCLLDVFEHREFDTVAAVNLLYEFAESVSTLSMLPIQKSATSQLYTLPMMHSPDCPCRAYRIREGVEYHHKKSLKLCACALLETSDNRFLLTRRDPRLSLFPKAWVFPGGHVDAGETIEHAVMREIVEETGIDLRMTEGEVWFGEELCRFRPFLLYESVFPSRLETGLPTSQHVIVFYYAKIPVFASEVRVTNSSEVDLSVWVTESQLSEIWNHAQGRVEGVGRHGIRSQVNYEQLAGHSPNEIGEGMGRAHFLALQFWFDHRPS